MNTKDYDKEKELIELAHKFRMEQIEFEKNCRLECQAKQFDYEMQMHRMKRADIKRSIAEREAFRQ